MTTYLTMNQVREKLGNRGRTTLYRDIELGRIPEPIRLGGRIYWPEDQIEAAMERLKDPSPMALVAKGRS